MNNSRYMQLLVGVLAMAAAPQLSLAATMPLTLVGHAADLTYLPNSSYSGNTGPMIPCGPCDVGILSLTDTATGTQQSQGFEVFVGDTISGTVSLDQPLSVHASDAGLFMNLNLFGYPQDNPGLTYDVSFPLPGTIRYRFALFNGGAPASVGNLEYFGGSGGGALGFSGISFLPTGAFEFDRIEFSGTVESIQDSDLNFHTSLQLSPSPLQLTYFLAPAVPEPSPSLLMLSGLIATGFWCRRLRRVGER